MTFSHLTVIIIRVCLFTLPVKYDFPAESEG